MIKAEGDFAQVEMEKLLRHSAIHVKPMFGIAPEAFDAVDVVSTARSPLLFADDEMLAAHGQRSVSLPLVRLVEAARQGVPDDQAFKFLSPSSGDGKDTHHAMALEDAEDDDFACCSPATLPLARAAKHRLIALNRAVERLRAFFSQTEYLTQQAIESFYGRRACQRMETQTISWHTQDKVINEVSLGCFTQARSSPETRVGVATQAAATLTASVGQRPCPVMSTTWTRAAHNSLILLIT